MTTEYVIFCMLLSSIIRVDSRLTSVIETTKGPIQGKVLKTVINSVEYSSFKGIPYAEPPVGYLRFKPPVPKNAWQDVLQTSIEGSNCVQKDFAYQTIYTGSEDCLYLNVYTPKLLLENESVNEDLLPVMVWIYGGSFKKGYGNSSLYGPDFLIEEGVVVVTFNYRLGPLGFLNINHENATGNAGLKDQNLVLRWVNENIAKFGGNPNSVTISGQSAGGASADYHGLSEMSKGLFHQIISMSASPFCVWCFQTPQDALKQAFILGAKLGKFNINKKQLLKTLYDASALDIMHKTEEMGMTTPPFQPTLESTKVATNQEKFLTQCAIWKYLTGNFTKVPYLTGHTVSETILFLKSAESILNFQEYVSNVAKKITPKSSASIPLLSELSLKNIANFTVEKLIGESTDLLFVSCIDLKIKFLHNYSRQPVYYYVFGYADTERPFHRQIYNITLNGTSHGDDIPYLFHMTVANITLDPNSPTFITRKRMSRLWANFVKYGNPTPDGKQDTLLEGITWPDTGDSYAYLDFNINLTIKEQPLSKSAELFETLILPVLPLQSGCVGNMVDKLFNLSKSTVKSAGTAVVNTIKAVTSPISKLLT